MSRDGYREYTLLQMKAIARDAAVYLDGEHGDPAKAADWTRERKLAWFCLALIERISQASDSIEVRS